MTPGNSRSFAFSRPTAKPYGAAVCEHDLETEHGITRHPIFDAAQAAGVGRDVASERRECGAGWVGRIPKVVIGSGVAERLIDDTRLDPRDERRWIEFDEVAHAFKAQNDATVDRVRASAKPGAGAARHHRHAVGGCGTHD